MAFCLFFFFPTEFHRAAATGLAGPVHGAAEPMQEQRHTAQQRFVRVPAGLRGRLLPDGRVRRLLRDRHVLDGQRRAAGVQVPDDQLRRPVRERAVRQPVPERRPVRAGPDRHAAVHVPGRLHRGRVRVQADRAQRAVPGVLPARQRHGQVATVVGLQVTQRRTAS